MARVRKGKQALHKRRIGALDRLVEKIIPRLGRRIEEFNMLKDSETVEKVQHKLIKAQAEVKILQAMV